jgi:transcriptional regulator with XRE-family HTH domain
MRRGTHGAKRFGLVLKALREELGMSMREVADKLEVYPATVSQSEKGERAVKKEKVSEWSWALSVNEDYLMNEWLKSDALVEPPITRHRPPASTLGGLTALLKKLNATERERVRGYIEGVIESRDN